MNRLIVPRRQVTLAIILAIQFTVNAFPNQEYGIPHSGCGMMRPVTSLSKLFGKRLRELRVHKGFNQLYLATLASVSEDFISLVERGIKTPSFETIEALAAALETTVTALFTFQGEGGGRQRVRMVRAKEQSKKGEPAKKRSAAKVVTQPKKTAR